MTPGARKVGEVVRGEGLRFEDKHLRADPAELSVGDVKVCSLIQ